MTAERRLAQLEAALGPTELVLRWLAAAHAHDDFVAYTRSVVAAGPDNLPLDRLARTAIDTARTQRRGKPPAEVDGAIRRAVGETLFRVQLILRINSVSAEFLDRERLLQVALAAHLGLAVDDATGRRGPDRLGRLAQCRDLIFGRVTELHALETAPTAVEARYLDGVAADFPAARRAWAEQRTRSETMAVIALRIAELDGADPGPLDDPAAFDARVTILTAVLVEPARSTAYGELGDSRRAATIAMRWLAPKLG